MPVAVRVGIYFSWGSVMDQRCDRKVRFVRDHVRSRLSRRVADGWVLALLDGRKKLILGHAGPRVDFHAALKAAIDQWDVLDFAAKRSAAGREWIESLPSLVQELSTRWNLHPQPGEIRHGYRAVVAQVVRSGEPLVLKVAWPPEATSIEALALAAWDGRGAVRAIETDPERGALLLERLDPDRSLADVPLEHAAELAGGLLRRLAVPAPNGIPALEAIAHDIAASLESRNELFGSPVSTVRIDTARALARTLAHDAQCLLVHSDLHYGNVLAGERAPWLAIDPRPVAGDPEYAVPELLWTRGSTSWTAARQSVIFWASLSTTGGSTLRRRWRGASCAALTTGCGVWRTGSRTTRCDVAAWYPRSNPW